MKNACVILSVINTIPAPLSYAPRSIYTCKERFEQTLLSIESVQKKIPDVDIYLVECSIIPQEMESILKSKCNYINYYSNEDVKKMVESPYKGSGEAMQMLTFLETTDINKYDNIFKLSGRYRLSDKFNYNNFNNNNNCYQIRNGDHVSTILYKLNSDYISLYKDILKVTCYLCYHKCIGFEHCIFNLFKDYITNVSPLGIEGNVAIEGIYINY